MRPYLIICPFLALLTWAAFWPALHCGFTNYDDPRFIVKNPYVRGGFTSESVRWAFAPGATENWHPLTWLSLTLDAEIYGDPGTQSAHVARGFHATNLVLHTLSVLVLFAALARMTAAPWRSAAVAALFAIHPLHVESVAWVAERKDVLSTLFALVALWAYANYAQPALPGTHPLSSSRKAWYALSLLAFACSLLSKQMHVTLPFVFLILDYWPLKRLHARVAGAGPQGSPGPLTAALASTNPQPPPVPPRQSILHTRHLLLEKIPFFALAAAFSAIAYLAQQTGGTITAHHALATRIANALVVYVLYLGKTAWPMRLAVFYPHPGDDIAWWSAAAALAFLIAVTAFAVARRRTCPYFLVGWLWYLGTLVPVIGLVQIGMQRMADRYTYFPLVGIFVAAVWLVAEFCAKTPARRYACGLAAFCAIAAFAFVARQQATVWRDSLTLFQHALDVTQNNALAHNNLGVALREAGRRDDALLHFQEALRIRPDDSDAHNNLGTELQARGQPDAALAHFETASRLDPSLAQAHVNAANMLQQFGRLDEALARYHLALRLEPESAVAHNNLANVLQLLGRLDEARDEFLAAIRLDPRYAAPRYNLGNLLQQQGRLDESLAQYRAALEIQPDYAAAHRNLARALHALGDDDAARRHYRDCLRLNPNDPFAREGLRQLDHPGQ